MIAAFSFPFATFLNYGIGFSSIWSPFANIASRQFNLPPFYSTQVVRLFQCATGSTSSAPSLFHETSVSFFQIYAPPFHRALVYFFMSAPRFPILSYGSTISKSVRADPFLHLFSILHDNFSVFAAGIKTPVYSYFSATSRTIPARMHKAVWAYIPATRKVFPWAYTADRSCPPPTWQNVRFLIYCTEGSFGVRRRSQAVGRCLPHRERNEANV